jgi:uncharacterized membrane protein (UPF0127 family)
MKKAINEKNKFVLCENLKVANTFITRLVGLMGSKKMDKFDALLIEPCNSIHTFFMKYPLDVVFLDADNRVVKCVENLAPWRMTFLYLNAKKVLELNAGVLKSQVSKGDQIQFYV